MASYSTDDQFFADVADFIRLMRGNLPKYGWQEALLRAAIKMTENGVFTTRRTKLTMELLERALHGAKLTPEYIDNFLVEKNARKKPTS